MSAVISRTVRKGASLGEQIEQLERQVIERQQRVHGQAKALARDVHRRLTSPASLFAVAGVGFIFGLISGRREAAGPPPRPEDRPSSSNWRQIAFNLVFSALPAAVPKIIAFFSADCPPPPQADSPIDDQAD